MYAYAANGVNTSPTNEVQPYFDIAKAYGFANYMFQTNQGPSFPAHQFLFSGTSAPVSNDNDSGQYWTWFASENPVEIINGVLQPKGSPTGCLGDTGANPNYVVQIDPTGSETNTLWLSPYLNFPVGTDGHGYPCYDHNTIATVLDSAQPNPITWKFYTNDTTSLWTAPNAIRTLCQPGGTNNIAGQPCQGSDWANVVEENYAVNGHPAKILEDIASCSLPNVSFVTPDGQWSDHTGGCKVGYPFCGTRGPAWVANIVNSVGQSSCSSGNFNDTVILITWDDWGGWYDHVLPPSVGTGYQNGSGNGKQFVYGFRVPLLVVSAYTPAKYVSGPAASNAVTSCPTNPTQYCHDFGSILNFIEYVFGSAGQPLGEIGSNGSSTYHYADYWALDGPHSCPTCPYPYSLADFFGGFQTQNRRTFTSITVPTQYPPSYFIGYTGTAQPPDDDGAEQ
jgi:hypothetical protein